MKIDPIERYSKEVFALLKEIEYERKKTGNNRIVYSIRIFPFNKKSIDLQLIIRNMEKDGIVKIVDDYESSVGSNKDYVAQQFDLEVVEPMFSELYKSYEEAFGTNKQARIKITKKGRVELIVKGKEYKADFRTGSGVYKVLKKLANNRGEKLSFEELEKVLENNDRGTPERRVRDSIQHIKEKLGYKGDGFIETDYGFRLVCEVEIVN